MKTNASPLLMRRWLLIALPAVVALTLSGAQARTFHVAPGGDDANPGTTDSPLRTMQKAAEVARAGDTVLVRGGVYRGHVFLRFSGEPEKPVVFRNAPGERPVLDGEGKGRIELQSEHGWQKPVGWVVVEGFEMRNGWDGISENFFYRNAVGLGTGDCQRFDFRLRAGSPAFDASGSQSAGAPPGVGQATSP